MKRMFIAAAALTVFLTLTVTAFGALPKKGAVFIGDIKAQPFSMHINMGVNAKGAAAHFTYLCGTGFPPTSVFNVPIDSTGHFKYTSNPATGHAWKMVGHFVTPTTAFVSLNSIDCGGSKGSTTLKLK